ncbi:MAG: hypothetical protein MUF12_06310 [Sediminibacterium sp.]|jgi:Fe-S cluster biosynthesis and repair protein YggX|nr:hypothetical protein [Sediminibacterium sp.]
MTVDEIYTYLGQKLYDAIPDEIEIWDKAVMYAERLDKYFSAGATLFINEKKINLEDFDARTEMAQNVHELHAITTEGGHNRWNKLVFTLYPNFKFNLDFIWNQEWQDEVDKYNNEA